MKFIHNNPLLTSTACVNKRQFIWSQKEPFEWNHRKLKDFNFNRIEVNYDIYEHVTNYFLIIYSGS